MDDDKLFEEFYQRLRIGLPGVESGGGNYSAQNSQGSAAGKYQFTKQWLSEAKYGKNSITSFARNSKVFEVPKDMEDFKSNPELQDAYFKHYSKNVLYPKAKDSIKGKNPLNLSLDQIGALMHFQGESNAKRQIQTGKLSKATKKGKDGASYDNISGQGYLDKYNKTNSSYGLAPIDRSITTSDSDKEKITKSFIERDNAINNLDVPQGAKEKLRAKLYQTLADNGQREIVNEHIEKENIKNQERFDAARNLEAVLESASQDQNSVTNSFTITTDEDSSGDANKAMQDFPELFKGATKLTDGNIFIGSGVAKNFSNKLLKLNNEGEINVISDQTTGNKIYNIINKIIPDVLKSGALPDHKQSLKKGSNNITSPKKRPLIDGDIFKPRPIKDTTPNEDNDSKKKTNPKKSGEVDKIKSADDVPDNTAEEFFQRALGLGNVSPDDFGLGETTEDLPIDAITGLALGLIGNNQAEKAKIPLRTEEVSDAMKSYTAELARRSKEGLPVEVEAAMKSQLADAYQGGLENIVNASGGNRALVLGNQGQLEQAKNKGLIGIQVADYEAKEKAFAQYGKAIEYINDFDARRDIANHGIEYGEAKQKQTEGKQLATAGFGKLMDALSYQKENGPGSTNDMYRSLLMQKMFGFDPKMKDDGSGSVKGTKSYFDKNFATAKEEKGIALSYSEKFNALSPDNKKEMNTFIKNNSNTKDVYRKMDELNGVISNDAPVNSNEGLESMNETIEQPKPNVPNEITLSPEDLENEGTGLSNPENFTGLENPFPEQETEVPELATSGFNSVESQNGLLDEYYNNQ